MYTDVCVGGRSHYQREDPRRISRVVPSPSLVYIYTWHSSSKITTTTTTMQVVQIYSPQDMDFKSHPKHTRYGIGKRSNVSGDDPWTKEQFLRYLHSSQKTGPVFWWQTLDCTGPEWKGCDPGYYWHAHAYTLPKAEAKL